MQCKMLYREAVSVSVGSMQTSDPASLVTRSDAENIPPTLNPSIIPSLAGLKWWKYYSEYTETYHRRLRVQVRYRCDQVCCQILGGLQASHQLMMMMKITWAASSFSSRMNATYQVCHGTACTRTYIAPIFEMISVHAVHTISWHIEIEDFVQSLGISSFSWTKAQNISIEQTWLHRCQPSYLAKWDRSADKAGH